MFPFAVLGFVMKPLQLKGAFRFSSCVDAIFLAIPSYSQQFVYTGFSPIESRKASTAVSEVKGAAYYVDFERLPFVMICMFLSLQLSTYL